MLTTSTGCGGGGSSNGGGGGGGGQVISIAINPTTASVIVTQSKTFAATVSNSTNTAVTWSVQEGSAGGTMTAAGVYTAPSQAGTYHVVATSQADTSKSASAVVTVTPAPAPTFTSTAPTSASQGTAYAYTVAATDPAGGTVTFQLTTAPTGATLTGNQLSWTPSAAQSRTPNSFTITATTSEGGSGTQSFSISPSGTINVTRVFTYHSTDIDGNFTTNNVTDMALFPIAVYIPDGSGSFTTISATGVGTGHYSATNVPAGYYWFENGASNYIWTRQSSVDTGNDANGRDYSTIAFAATGTTLDVSMGGASAWKTTDIALVNSPNSLAYLPFGSASAGDTTLSSTINMEDGPVIDSSLGDYAIAYQLVHHSLTGGGYVGVERFFGPTALTATTGTSNTLSGTFTPVTTSSTVRLSVKASQFAAFTASMGPGATNHSTCAFVRALPSTASTGYTGVAGDILLTDDCASGTPTVADEDLGDVAYGNPYPPYPSNPNSSDTWPLFAGFVHQVEVPYQLAGTTAPYNATATNIVYKTTLPTSTSPVVPLVSPVRNPTIRPFGGTSTSLLATSVTGVGLNPVISWQAPSTGTPTGYTVEIIPLVPSGNPTVITVGLSPVFLWVGGSVNAIQVPPGVLTAGGSYGIRITARIATGVDAEASPFRRSLPYAESQVLSGVVTP